MKNSWLLLSFSILLLLAISLDPSEIGGLNDDVSERAVAGLSNWTTCADENPDAPQQNFQQSKAGQNGKGENLDFDAREMIGWAEWIWLLRQRQQPSRNPQRRFRLSKKKRRRLRKSLENLLLREEFGVVEQSSLCSSSDMELG